MKTGIMAVIVYKRTCKSSSSPCTWRCMLHFTCQHRRHITPEQTGLRCSGCLNHESKFRRFPEDTLKAYFKCLQINKSIHFLKSWRPSARRICWLYPLRQSGELTQHDPPSLTEPFVLSSHVCGIRASVRLRTVTRWRAACVVAASSEVVKRCCSSPLVPVSHLRFSSSLTSLNLGGVA